MYPSLPTVELSTEQSGQNVIAKPLNVGDGRVAMPGFSHLGDIAYAIPFIIVGHDRWFKADQILFWSFLQLIDWGILDLEQIVKLKVAFFLR